jgi:hypothetical protein
MRIVNSQLSIVNSQWKFFSKALLITYYLLLITSLSFSQKLTATINQDKVVIGAQVELQLKLEPSNNSQNIVNEWVAVPDTFNHIEVVKRLPVDTIQVEGQSSYLQKIILTSFDTGRLTIPVFTVMVNNKPVSSQPVQLTILPVDVSGMKDYHEIKDILEVAKPINWLLIISIISSGILLIAIAWFFFRNKKKQSVPEKKIQPFNANEALNEIKKVQQKEYIPQRKFKAFFTELVDVCKYFSDAQINVSSFNKTTDEYMLQIKNNVGEEQVQTQYFQLLRLSDAVKFAKYIPSETECDQSIEIAISFIKTMSQFMKTKK